MHNYCYGFTIYVFTITVTALQGLCINVRTFQELCTITFTALQGLCIIIVMALQFMFLQLLLQPYKDCV